LIGFHENRSIFETGKALRFDELCNFEDESLSSLRPVLKTMISLIMLHEVFQRIRQSIIQLRIRKVLSVFGWCIAAVLLWLVSPLSLSTGGLIVARAIIFATFMSSALVFVGAKVKYPDWVALLIVSVDNVAVAENRSVYAALLLAMHSTCAVWSPQSVGEVNVGF
jgi:hypothetical protein